MLLMEMSDDAVRAAMDTLSNELALYCAPALIVPSLGADPMDIIAGGTISLVATPSKQLFITAYHVWQRLNRAKQDHPDAVIAAYVGPPYGVIALTEIDFLDGDEHTLDLAIFHAPRVGSIRLYGKQFFQIPQWPIPRVRRWAIGATPLRTWRCDLISFLRRRGNRRRGNRRRGNRRRGNRRRGNSVLLNTVTN
jgi:hypothetical protein